MFILFSAAPADSNHCYDYDSDSIISSFLRQSQSALPLYLLRIPGSFFKKKACRFQANQVYFCRNIKYL